MCPRPGQTREEQNPKYFYCKLNLLGSPRIFSIKPTSDFLNGERNIYGAVFIP